MNELGRGGTGAVYRAFDESLERDVALKLLRREYFHNPEFLANLESEAAITASISHPNVVKVYSAGCKNSFYYIAMEIISGGSLAVKLERQGRLSEAEVYAVGIQAARGLQAAYERGLLHRDVKPGNLLYADADILKVADFGLAIPVEQAKGDSGDIWGTPEYIAPEKLLQEGEDERSDIYSLGCTLFHCLTGCTPFGTQKLDQLIACKAQKGAPDLQQLAPNASGAMAFVIARCLEREPAKRYQSYSELIEHLEYARDQVAQPKARADAPRSAESKNAGKRKGMIWGVAAAVSLAAVIAVVSGLLHRRQNAAPIETPSSPASIAPREQVTQFRELDLRSVCTIDSRKGIFSGPKMADDTLEFAKYGRITANGIPFLLIDPAQNPSGCNVLAFKGKSMPFPSTATVNIAHESVRKLHFLGGVAGWGWPATPGGKLGLHILRLTVLHSDQQKEIFEFENGLEFANHKPRVDVPGSTFADGVSVNGHQVRTFSVTLQKKSPVTSLSFASLDPVVAPVFVAITAETAP
jgi:serine/threonine protein kinase